MIIAMFVLALLFFAGFGVALLIAASTKRDAHEAANGMLILTVIMAGLLLSVLAVIQFALEMWR